MNAAYVAKHMRQQFKHLHGDMKDVKLVVTAECRRIGPQYFELQFKVTKDAQITSDLLFKDVLNSVEEMLSMKLEFVPHGNSQKSIRHPINIKQKYAVNATERKQS